MGKILLVEDDNNLREIYGARLQAEGHEIVSARDGEEALAVAVKEKPDLIIADIMMPRISGFDMLDILRNAPETKNTKIIMMTALSQQEDKEHAQKLGADKYLVKSQVTLEDVAKVVRETLSGEPSGPPGGSVAAASAQPDPGKPAQPPTQPEPSTPPPKPPEPPAAASDPPPTTTPTPASQAPPSAPSTPALPSTPPTLAPAGDNKPASPAATTSPQTDDKPQSPASAPTAPMKPSMSTPPALDDKTNSQKPDGGNPLKTSSINIPVVEPPKPKADSTPDTSKSAETPAISGPAATVEPVKPVAEPSTDELPAQPEPKKEEQTKIEEKPATPGDNVGPNLAEALADEEKHVKEQIKDFEQSEANSAPPAEAEPGEPPVISPDKPAPAPDSEPSSTKADDEQLQKNTDDKPDATASTTTDGMANKKKVINPINDLSKKPDLEAMAAKEEASAKVINQAQQNVVKAGLQQPPDEDKKPPASGTHKDSQLQENKPNPHDISI